MTQTPSLHRTAQLAKVYSDLAFAHVQHGGDSARLDAAREELLAALVEVGEAGEQITLRLSWREDGGLRVTCDQRPGLLLSHSRADLVMADILPALAVMGWSAKPSTPPQQ